MRCLISRIPMTSALVLALALGRGAGAQVSVDDTVRRGPRFLLASASRMIPLDVGRTPVLGRRLSLDLDGVTLKEALAEISMQSGLRLVYSDDIVPLDSRVHLRADAITVAAALTDVLLDAGVDVVFSRNGQAALVPRSPARKPVRRLVGILTGQVSDAETNQPVRSAQVLVVGTQRGALTNDEGRYTVTGVPAGTHQVRVLRVGYASVTQPVTVADGATATLDFRLTQSVVTFDEVVVTATGEEQRKREAGVSVGTVDPADVALAATNTLPQLLTGRVPGLTVQQSGGISGTGSKVRIRGANSVTLFNDPLLIVDGVRVNNAPQSLSYSLSAQTPSRITDLDPDEIEKIEVIKGPAAAALYGTAAANGVIQIITKRGRAGKARWTAFTEVGGLYEVTDYPANYTQFGDFGGGSEPGCTLNFQVAGFCTPDSLAFFNPLEQNTPFRDGVRQKYGLSVAGGGDQMTYFVSGDYEGEEGVYEVNQLDRVHVRANLTSQVSDRFNFSVSTGYLSSDLRLPGELDPLGIVSGGLFGSFQDDPVRRGYEQAAPEDIYEVEAWQNVERFTGSANADWRPSSWLSFNGTAGTDFIVRHDHLTVPPNVFVDFANLVEGSRVSNRLETFTYTANGSGSAEFNLTPELLSTTSLGAQYQRDVFSGTFASGENLTPGTNSLNAVAVRFDVGESTQDVRTIGGFVQQKLAWRDRLFLTAAVRGDDNSAFGNEFGITYYPSVNASWVIGEEPWFPQTTWVSSLRLRGGWGKSGLRPNFRQAITFFAPLPVTVDGEDVLGFAIAGTGNAGLRPEKVSELELGFDVSLWQNRIGLQFSYFDKESDDALVARNLAPSLAAGTRRFENIGRVRNEGFEALINAQLVNRSRVTWEMTLSGSTLENELLELGEGVTPITFSAFGTQRHVEGYSLGGYWGRRIRSFTDADGDGIISGVCPGAGCEITLGDTAEFLGSSFPLREASISTTITLFNVLRLYGLVDHRGRYKQFNFTEVVRCAFNSNCLAVNSKDASLHEQARAAALVGFPPPTVAGFVEDASFWKLREVAVTLLAPRRWAQRVGAESLSLTLSGRNLATWTDYTGLDPEISTIGQDNFLQAEVGSQPNVRQYTARLTVAF